MLLFILFILIIIIVIISSIKYINGSDEIKTLCKGAVLVINGVKNILDYNSNKSKLYKVYSLLNPILAMAIIALKIDINDYIVGKTTIKESINTGTNIDLLKKLISKKAKMRYTTYIDLYIFQTLRMRNSFFQNSKTATREIINEYDNKDKDKDTLITTTEDYGEFLSRGMTDVLYYPEQIKIYKSLNYFKNDIYTYESGNYAYFKVKERKILIIFQNIDSEDNFKQLKEELNKKYNFT